MQVQKETKKHISKIHKKNRLLKKNYRLEWGSFSCFIRFQKEIKYHGINRSQHKGIITYFRNWGLILSDKFFSGSFPWERLSFNKLITKHCKNCIIIPYTHDYVRLLCEFLVLGQLLIHTVYFQKVRTKENTHQDQKPIPNLFSTARWNNMYLNISLNT